MGRAKVLIVCLLATAFTLQADASFDRFLFRRQSPEGGEQESTTTPKPAQGAQQQQQQQQPNNNNAPGNNGRLYPDLLRGPNFIPPFNAPPGQVQPPFVPFGMQMPGGPLPNRLNADQQPAPFGRMPVQPRPMSAIERLRSQTFTDGLGKRLLSMIGIDMGNQTTTTGTTQEGAPPMAPATPGGHSPGQMDPATMRALQNATVLEKLSQRVNMVMGGLSRMYNSTVQDQMTLLNERLKKAAENSTNPWQQRMAQQVPMFFKQMADRVGGAQEQLNRMWHDVNQAAQGNASVLNRPNGQPRPFFGSFDQFMNPNFFGANNQGMEEFGMPSSRSQNMAGSNQAPSAQQQQQQPQQQQPQNQPDMATKLREFWHVQVQPQVSNLRGQMARMWRDMTASGALAPDAIMRSRFAPNNLGSANQNGSSSSDIVDNILKEIDMDNTSEYALVDSKGEPAASTAESGDSPTTADDKSNRKEGGGGSQMVAKLSPAIQNRLVETQRDVNQLWMGLTNSLQGALANLRNSMSQRRASQSSGVEPMAEADPKQNEIDTKISDLSKLQRDADTIQQVVQQQQRETQQRQSIGDRFRGFVNNMDLSGVNQLPDRIGEQFNRFGNAVGNFWNQIPERWDNLMAGPRQSNQSNMMRA